MIDVLVAQAQKEEEALFRESLLKRLRAMKSRIESERLLDPVSKKTKTAIDIAIRKLDPAELKKQTSEKLKSGASPRETEEAIAESEAISKEAVAESGSDLTKLHAKNLLQIEEAKQRASHATPEQISASPVIEKLAEVSEVAIRAVKDSSDAMVPTEGPLMDSDRVKRDAGNEGIRKANALLQAAIESKREIADTGTDQPGGSTPAAASASVVKKVLEQARTQLPVLENTEGARQNAALRQQIFEGTGITRLVVVIHRVKGRNRQFASPAEQEALDKLAEETREMAEAKLQALLQSSGESEVVSAIDRLWLVERELDTEINPPSRNQLRYLKDLEGSKNREKVAKALANYLEDEIGLSLETVAYQSGIAEGEYEIWLASPETEPDPTPPS